MIDALQDRITASADGLSGADDGEFAALLDQRARVLTQSVQPLIALATGDAEQTAPAYQTVAAFGIVGLAAGALLVIGARFARPTIEEPRVAQRLVERPAVGFGDDGSPEAARLVRRLLDDRPKGAVLVVPVDAEAEKDGPRVRRLGAQAQHRRRRGGADLVGRRARGRRPGPAAEDRRGGRRPAARRRRARPAARWPTRRPCSPPWQQVDAVVVTT